MPPASPPVLPVLPVISLSDVSRPATSRPVSSRPPGTVTHAPYRREPYIRCRMPSSIIDGKAAAWIRTAVLLHWIDDGGRAHNRWVPAAAVQRINRDDSAWQDPYDDWSFYYPESAAAVPLAA